MKKRIFSLLKTLVFAAALIPAFPIYANDDISVYLNGERLEFDVPPMIIDNRTMVPMRVIFEALGAEVEWDGQTQRITAEATALHRTIATFQIGNYSVYMERFYLWIGYEDGDHPDIYWSGWTVELDVPPQIVNGRTLVPLRAVSEIFGAAVEWEANTRTVLINTENNTNAVPRSSHFVSHYFLWGGRFNDFIETLEDDFFAENYLVVFEIGSPVYAMPYYVADVRANGDIVLRELPYAANDAESSWYVVIELENSFAPDSFTVVFEVEREWLSRRNEIPVRVIRESASTHEPFVLTISAEKTTLLQGENFQVRVDLKNNSGENQTIAFDFLLFPFIPDWNFALDVNLPALDPPYPVPRLLPAGHVWRNLDLWGSSPVDNRAAWSFGNTLEPGTHELKFRAGFFLNWGENDQKRIEVWSNTIMLTVL